MPLLSLPWRRPSGPSGSGLVNLSPAMSTGSRPSKTRGMGGWLWHPSRMASAPAGRAPAGDRPARGGLALQRFDRPAPAKVRASGVQVNERALAPELARRGELSVDGTLRC